MDTIKLVKSHEIHIYYNEKYLKLTFLADDSYPNLIPLLTGLNVNEFVKECIPLLNHDGCHFIWKDFENKGYQTVFGEDCDYAGLFTLDKSGFKIQPTDYFFNTFISEAETAMANNKRGLFYMCLGDKKPNEVMFKYIEKFVKTKKNDTFFSFFWATAMTQEFINYPTLIDDDLSNLLIKIEKEGYLNKTVLLLMSDHGIRYGDFRKTNQGMIEERQPLLYFILPKWFKQTYPEAYKNLMINRRRLITPFDIYETLQELLEPKLLAKSRFQSRSMESLEELYLHKSISLFLEVLPNRTCERAGIASHWCTCFERKQIAITDELTQEAATFVVKYINDLLINYSNCRKLSLNSILFANLEANSNNFKFGLKRYHTTYDIIIGIETKPSMAKFEATVRFPEDGSKKLHIFGKISRLNIYGNQSHCIDNNKLKLYCFCIT